MGALRPLTVGAIVETPAGLAAAAVGDVENVTLPDSPAGVALRRPDSVSLVTKPLIVYVKAGTVSPYVMVLSSALTVSVALAIVKLCGTDWAAL